MCILCDQGKPQNHSRSQLGRRDFLKASSAAAAGAAGMSLFGAPPARADHDGDLPHETGRHGRRYVIRGGHVMSMDPAVGDFVEADVLVEGKLVKDIKPRIQPPGAGVIDARGKIVMPGFVDTHHHLFETALRSFLADGLLFDGLDPNITNNYFQKILLGFAPAYRPEDVYISELFGALSSLDAGVTTVHDISQIHHSPAHSDAAIAALKNSDRRAVFGYFESAGNVAGNQYPTDAKRIKSQHFASSDQLVTMFMGGEIYLPGFGKAWAIGRELNIPIAAHIVGTFGMRPTFDDLAKAKRFGPDNLFIHMTGMSDEAWQAVADAGAGVSLAVPIEMNMRHGTPPILKAIDLGFNPSLSTDVEVTLTADMFTQMRTAMALQRMFVNARALFDAGTPNEAYAAGLPAQPLLTVRDVLRWATINGARDLKLESKTGTLTPGKEADIIILDPDVINVAPLNHVPGAVVSLMERNNVDTVICAGKIRKWKGKLLDVNLRKLRNDIENSRDFLFGKVLNEEKPDLFRPS
jgi:cytosine/adenosine deaminase-related metal-dependent hydrolase